MLDDIPVSVKKTGAKQSSSSSSSSHHADEILALELDNDEPVPLAYDEDAKDRSDRVAEASPPPAGHRLLLHIQRRWRPRPSPAVPAAAGHAAAAAFRAALLHKQRAPAFPAAPPPA